MLAPTLLDINAFKLRDYMKLIATLVLLISFNTFAASTFLGCSGEVFTYGRPEGTITYTYNDSLEVNIDKGYFMLGPMRIPLKYTSETKLATSRAINSDMEPIVGELDRVTGDFTVFYGRKGNTISFSSFYDMKCKKRERLL